MKEIFCLEKVCADSFVYGHDLKAVKRKIVMRERLLGSLWKRHQKVKLTPRCLIS